MFDSKSWKTLMTDAINAQEALTDMKPVRQTSAFEM